jgi:hypothetical protein
VFYAIGRRRISLVAFAVGIAWTALSMGSSEIRAELSLVALWALTVVALALPHDVIKFKASLGRVSWIVATIWTVANIGFFVWQSHSTHVGGRGFLDSNDGFLSRTNQLSLLLSVLGIVALLIVFKLPKVSFALAVILGVRSVANAIGYWAQATEISVIWLSVQTVIVATAYHGAIAFVADVQLRKLDDTTDVVSAD